MAHSVDANNLDGTTTLWCTSLNQVAVCYGSNHESKVRCYGTLV